MPIRVPTIVSQQSYDIGRQPPEIGTNAAAEYASGINRAIDSIGQAAQHYAHVKDTLQKQQDKQDAELAKTELERQYADADIRRKSDPTVTPDQFTTGADSDLANMRKGIGASLKTDQSRAIFQASTEEFVRTKSVEAKYHALKRQNGEVKMGFDSILRGYAIDSVNAGPSPGKTAAQNQVAAFEKGMKHISDALGSEVISADEARAAELTFRETIAEATARRNMENPALQTQTIAQLKRLEFWPLRADRQQELAQQFQHQLDTADKDAKAKAKEARQELERKADKDVTDFVVHGAFDAARKTLIYNREAFDGPRYEALHNFITTQQNKGTPSDEIVHNRLSLETYSVDTDPRLVMNKVKTAFEIGVLNRQDFKPLAEHLEVRINKLKDGDSSLGARHRDAQHIITEALKVTGPAAAVLNIQAQQILVEALKDLSRTSSYLGRGDQDPGDWIEKRSSFYIGQLQSAAISRMNVLKTAIRDAKDAPFHVTGDYYADFQRLQAQQGQFKTPEQYWNQVRILKDMSDLSLEVARTRAAMNPATTPVPPGPQVPSGPGPSAPPSPPSAPSAPSSGGNTLTPNVGMKRGRSQTE